MNTTMVATKCETCNEVLDYCQCPFALKLRFSPKLLILQHPQESRKPYGTAKLLHLCVTSSILKVGLSWKNLSHALGSQTLNADWVVLYRGNKVIKSIGLEGDTAPPKGIIILDGNWKQAKALWWRNPWLNKIRKISLPPDFQRKRSLIAPLKKTPRKESLSTLEAFTSLTRNQNPDSSERLERALAKMVTAFVAKPKPTSAGNGRTEVVAQV